MIILEFLYWLTCYLELNRVAQTRSKYAAQHALAPDAALLRFAAQVKRELLGGYAAEEELPCQPNK